MFNIKTLNAISPIGTKKFGKNYTFSPDAANPDAVLVRSASMHDAELGENLLAIARAGAGVNNIPVEKCSEQAIVVFNTPGANANAVKELVLATLFLTSRKIIPATEWIKSLKGKGDEVGKLVEKNKSQFAGPEIKGKTLGVIGLGAIGILVANAAKSLGMTVYGYDPYLSVDAAWNLSHSVNRSLSVDEIYANSDYISIHVPLKKDTRAMINADAFAKMKDDIRILNFSRGELVHSSDMVQALTSGKVAAYATDFPQDELIDLENVIAIPHLGASTPESEENCAEMAVDELKNYLEEGNILNSVNFPNVNMQRDGAERICIIHKNVPNTISELTSICGTSSVNIENMQSKSLGNYAYTILDVSCKVTDSAIDAISQLPQIIRVRVIR